MNATITDALDETRTLVKGPSCEVLLQEVVLSIVTTLVGFGHKADAIPALLISGEAGPMGWGLDSGRNITFI